MAHDEFHILMVEDKAAYHPIYESAITDAMPCTISFAIDGVQALELLSTGPNVDMLVLI